MGKCLITSRRSQKIWELVDEKKLNKAFNANNLDSILKSRDITLPTKVHLVKAVVFSSGHVWM